MTRCRFFFFSVFLNMALCLYRWNSFWRLCSLWRETCIAFWIHLWGLEGSWRWRWHSCFCCSGRFLRTRSLNEAVSFGSWCVQKCLIKYTECFWRVLWSKNVKHMFCLLIYNKEDSIWVTCDYVKNKKTQRWLEVVQGSTFSFKPRKKRNTSQAISSGQTPVYVILCDVHGRLPENSK